MNTLSTLEFITILMAFASLTVSVLAFLYTRRSFNFEKYKFKVQETRTQEERKKTGIYLNVLKTERYETEDMLLLRTEFTISNRSLGDMYIRALSVLARFSSSSLWNAIKHGNAKFYFSIVPNSSVASFGGSYSIYWNDDWGELSAYTDDIRAIVRHLKTKNDVLDRDGWTLLEAGTTTHLWETVAIMPIAALKQAEELGYTLTSTGIQVYLQNEHKIESTSSVRICFVNDEEEVAELNKLLSLFKNKNGG